MPPPSRNAWRRKTNGSDAERVHQENEAWKTHSPSGRKCLKLDPRSNRPVCPVPEASACDLAFGEGSLWAVKFAFSRQELRRIDPETRMVVAPLSAGSHTIQFTGALTLSVANGDPFDLDFRLEITYHLTVGRN